METFAPPGAESTLTDSKTKIQYRVCRIKAVGNKMATKGKSRVVPTITVGRDYGWRVEGHLGGIRAAFGATIDLSPKNTHIAVLAPNTPSRLAFYRVGAALRNSFAKARVKPE